jgi:hypothetical protein
VEPLKTLIALAIASTVTAVHAAAPKVAVFDFEFVDTSIEGATNGPRGDEGARLARLDREMRQRLAQSGRADVVDVARVVDRTRARDLRTCGGCDAKFASELGAKYSVTGWVQKVSNLILNMNTWSATLELEKSSGARAWTCGATPTNHGRALSTGSSIDTFWRRARESSE